MTLHNRIFLEIAIDLEGTFVRGYPQCGPTYDCGGEPAEPDSVEDLTITDISAVDAKYVNGKWVHFTTSLLANVDRKSEAFQMLVRNLLAHAGSDAVDALLEGAE